MNGRTNQIFFWLFEIDEWNWASIVGKYFLISNKLINLLTWLCDEINVSHRKNDTYNGGSETDIKGNGTISKTGREALIAENESKNGAATGPNGYGPDKPYKAPELDGEDQFIVD